MNNLQIQRKSKGISQSQLSILSGIPISSIQSIERGHCTIESAAIEVVVNLANGLGCKLSEIIDDKSVKELLLEVEKEGNLVNKIDDYRDIMDNVEDYTELEKQQQELMLSAYAIAKKVHAGQTRDEGTPYFDHCVRIAESASFNKKDYQRYVIGLLHDTLEDTSLTYEEIEKLFGWTIAQTVLLLTRTRNQTYAEYVNKIVASNNVAAFFIKIYDKIDNLTSLDKCGKAGKIEKCKKEVKEVFLPIMKTSRFSKAGAKLLEKIEMLSN